MAHIPRSRPIGIHREEGQDGAEVMSQGLAFRLFLGTPSRDFSSMSTPISWGRCPFFIAMYFHVRSAVCGVCTMRNPTNTRLFTPFVGSLVPAYRFAVVSCKVHTDHGRHRPKPHGCLAVCNCIGSNCDCHPSACHDSLQTGSH